MGAVEAARAESLRPGVVGEDVRRDVPGQVGAALIAALTLVQVDAEAVSKPATGRTRGRPASPGSRGGGPVRVPVCVPFGTFRMLEVAL